MDELEIAWTDQHGDDREATGGQGLALVGVERGRGDEVVVEAVQAFWQVVDERALGLDEPRELVDEPLRVVARVGVRAFGEEDADQRTGPLAFRRGGERGRGHFVGGETGMGRATEHLRDDPGERLGAASLRRSIGDVRARAMSARDVSGVGQPSIHGADRVRD